MKRARTLLVQECAENRRGKGNSECSVALTPRAPMPIVHSVSLVACVQNPLPRNLEEFMVNHNSLTALELLSCMELGKALTSELNSEELFRKILHKVSELLPAENWS